MGIGWLWREKDPGAHGAGDYLERLAQELDGVQTEFRHLNALPLARAVEKAWTPDGLSRDQLATLIGANRGMSADQALTVLRAEQ
jgi:hypothetical protein